MSDRLAGKVAVVTGASKGIGAGIARGLGEAGASVVVNYASDRAGADRVVAEVTRKGGKAVAVQGDVSKAADVGRMLAEAIRAFGRLDILVNNAGVYKLGPFESITEEEFHRHYDTNVLGPILAVREALKHFGPEGGTVINISSIVGAAPWPQAVLYSSTKAAVDNLTRGLALELASRKVRVNAVAPGTTESEGTSDLHLFEGDEGKKVIASTPLGRLGTPADIARVVVFLASDDSAWVTGEVIRASGGLK
ncbi:MAG: SDR family NAD(P)-dependent oxidoreductase [Isosphaeraceae bacterium]